jgi:hypothetical protein
MKDAQAMDAASSATPVRGETTSQGDASPRVGDIGSLRSLDLVPSEVVGPLGFEPRTKGL